MKEEDRKRLELIQASFYSCNSVAPTGWLCSKLKEEQAELAKVNAQLAQAKEFGGMTVADMIEWQMQQDAKLAAMKAERDRAIADCADAKIHLRDAWTETPSHICRRYSVQCCHFCDDIECGDNTSPAKKKLARLKELVFGDEVREMVLGECRHDEITPELCDFCDLRRNGVEEFQQRLREAWEKP